MLSPMTKLCTSKGFAYLTRPRCPNPVKTTTVFQIPLGYDFLALLTKKEKKQVGA